MSQDQNQKTLMVVVHRIEFQAQPPLQIFRKLSSFSIPMKARCNLTPESSCMGNIRILENDFEYIRSSTQNYQVQFFTGVLGKFLDFTWIKSFIIWHINIATSVFIVAFFNCHVCP